MLFGASQESNDSINPTEFDKSRIKEMNVGDRLDGECGTFSIFKYKNDYTLAINLEKFKYKMIDFDTVEEMIEFMEKN